MANGVEYMRRETMIRFVRAFDQAILETELDQMPVKLYPQNGTPSRCCIYHDRAVLRYRLMTMLGFSCEEETDETRPLASYYLEARDRKPGKTEDAQPPLTVCAASCSGCPDSAYVVTGSCRGCFARPCVYNCPKNAISIVNHASQIDYSKCVKCGKCMAVCPFHAIIRTTVPCEEACPVGAIRKNEQGRAQIDFERCISCGKCFNACPFATIMERSQILDVLCALADPQQKVVAMVAPSAEFQFPGTIEQLFTAISKLGFHDVMEVALGAELTTQHEAAEFQEKMAEGQKLMTTSCCPAYVELVRRHYPEFLQYVSSTPSPMRYAAEIVKKADPEVCTVFIGPCIAKRWEAMKTENVDYILTFEELGSILAARKLDVISQEPWQLPRPAIATARNFAHSCGVTQAVLTDLTQSNPDFQLDSKFINGVDRKSLGQLKLYHLGKLPANFLEVMACEGGCVNGPCSLVKMK